MEIEVDLHVWADTYGQSIRGAEIDARNYLPTVVANAVAHHLNQQAAGAVLLVSQSTADAADIDHHVKIKEH